jgi:hypothetical protein
MALVVCSSCGRQTPDWDKNCRECGVALTVRGRKQQESAALAERIAASTSDPDYAAWQRSVIMNVTSGGGMAGLLLVFSSVIVCTLAFLGAHRLKGMMLKHDDGTPYSGGILFYLGVAVPVTVFYFRLAAPWFYRVHLRLSARRDV